MPIPEADLAADADDREGRVRDLILILLHSSGTNQPMSQILVIEFPGPEEEGNQRPVARILQTRGDPRLLHSDDEDQMAYLVVGTRETPRWSHAVVYTYTIFNTSEAGYTFYVPEESDESEPFRSRRYVMWRFDYARLQHSRSTLDFNDDTYHVQAPIIADNFLLMLGYDRNDPHRYPRIKYSWLAVPTLQFLALRALFAKAPVEVCERWNGWGRPSAAADFLRQIYTEKERQWPIGTGGVDSSSVKEPSTSN